MRQQILAGMPTASIAINKSRVKSYGKDSEIPTYYLQKGQEFQIELFNPTKDTIMAVISLNNKRISQGGLVLRPGERVFLDRYLDVAQKFKFDTYEVANTAEVRKAIEDNGDFKVEFYREMVIQPSITYNPTFYYNTNVELPYYCNEPVNFCDTIGVTTTTSTYNASASLGPQNLKKRCISSNTKSIETGRVEKGSYSNQKMESVCKNWEFLPFWTVSGKLLPLSQKVNTVKDIQVKRYCTACGTKLHRTDNFCSNCGKRA